MTTEVWKKKKERKKATYAYFDKPKVVLEALTNLWHNQHTLQPP